MNPYQTATLKELLLVTTFLSLAAAAFGRGGELESKLALATCGTCVYFVSLYAKPTFRTIYLLAFGILLATWSFEYTFGVRIFEFFFRVVYSATVEYGPADFGYYKFYSTRFFVFLAIVLVSVPYLVARICVAIWQPEETVEPPVSHEPGKGNP